MAPLRATAAALLGAAAIAAAGCGGDDDGGQRSLDRPDIGIKGTEKQAAQELGFPQFATKNTTRVGGADPVANAAGIAQAVFTGESVVTRPRAVALADSDDWRAGVAAAVLMSSPVRAPLLYSDGEDLPKATEDALATLKPTGVKQAGGAQVIRLGQVPRPPGLRATDIRGNDPFALARAIDAFHSAARGRTSDRVLVVSADDAGYAMPAAGWAAKSGDPVLFTKKDELPADTRAAIAAHQQPKIYLLGPSKVVSRKVEEQLRRLGTVTRIQGADPVANAIAFSRFVDGSFGWGIVDPGHGLVFASTERPGDAGASAPLSASGTYGPLLLVDRADRVPKALEGYLLDIQPGYTRDPVRGVYNHGWIVGDDDVISVAAQSRIDSLLEIVPVNERAR